MNVECKLWLDVVYKENLSSNKLALQFGMALKGKVFEKEKFRVFNIASFFRYITMPCRPFNEMVFCFESTNEIPDERDLESFRWDIENAHFECFMKPRVLIGEHMDGAFPSIEQLSSGWFSPQWELHKENEHE